MTLLRHTGLGHIARAPRMTPPSPTRGGDSESDGRALHSICSARGASAWRRGVGCAVCNVNKRATVP